MLYKDIIRLPPDFRECMDQAGIEQSPETWLDFYPHETFVEILRQILASMEGNGKSLWISGSYGVGKSHAMLVLQKLFMDDENRVRTWFSRYSDLVPDEVSKNLWAKRGEKTLVVYDANGDNLDGQTQFLIRLERTITHALRKQGLQVPIANAILPEILERIGEDPYFFVTRDRMQSRLPWLRSDIKDLPVLKRELERQLDPEIGNYGLTNDIKKVLEARHIYLPMNAATFLDWIGECLKINGLKRLVFIFDEFSGFINNNRGDLTTFQELAEAAQRGEFFLMPVTHESLEAFTGRGTETSRKVSDRFQFARLEMPTNVAIQLAGHILRPAPKMEEEWREQRNALWAATENLVKNYMARKASELKPEDFPKLLPLHPMSAIALKNLAATIGANQRSLFSFFNHAVFKNFMEVGGIEVRDHQFLTVDQLWNYFMAQSDPRTRELTGSARGEYERQKTRLTERQRRVFKAVLLYSLLERTQGETPLMNATVENIARSFEGDGNIGHDVKSILEELAKLRCVSLFNERCYLFQEATSGEDLEKTKKEWLDKFDDLILRTTPRTAIPGVKDTGKFIREHLIGSQTTHYDIYVGSKTINYSETAKESWDKGGNKALLQFIFARDEEERVGLPQKARTLATRHAGSRALFIVAPELSFCQADTKAWEKFVETYARYKNADTASALAYENELKSLYEDWERNVKLANLEVWRPNPHGEPFKQEVSWETLKKNYLPDWLKQVFPHNPDFICSGQISATGKPTNLKSWALAGMRMDDFRNPGAWKTTLVQWKKNGISSKEDWFEQNPDHALTKIRETCENYLKNTGDTGCSAVKLCRKLQHAPFGLLNIPHTAMCLGFVLKDWVSPKRGLQWSDGSAGGPLDETFLAEIIETGVKSSFGEKLRNEKLIYRLGPEEKAFIGAVQKMSGVAISPDQGVEGAINVLAERLERIAKGIPLWTLPWGMEVDPGDRELSADVLDKMTRVLSISSRGNLQEKTALVKELGRVFRERRDLPDIFKTHLNEWKFAYAFTTYANEVSPELRELAERLGDTSGAYLESVKSLLRESGSWQGKREDVEKALNETYRGLECCEVMSEIAGAPFHNFEDARKRLRDAATLENRIPLEAWQKSFPAFGRIFEILRVTGSLGERLDELYGLLKNNSQALREIFFDPERKAQLKWIGEKFPGLWPTTLEEGLAAYSGLPETSSGMAEAEFEKNLTDVLEKMARNRHLNRLITLWRQKTDSENIEAWSRRYLTPPQFAIQSSDSRFAVELANVLLAPERASAERLEEAADFLEKENAIRDPRGARDAFLRHVSSKRHANVLMWAGPEFIKWLKEKISPSPIEWLTTPGFQNYVDEFIANYYEQTAQPRAASKIEEMSEAKAKRVLKELVKNIPDAGFYVLKNNDKSD